MKNYLQKTILVFSLLLCLGAGQQVFAQVNGDFRSAATGTWGAAATWERFNGTSWEASGVGSNNPGSVPGSANSVFIQTGHTVTLAANASCNDLHIATGTTVASATLLGKVALATFTLSVNGKMRCYFATLNTLPGTTSSNGYAIYPFTASTGKVSLVGNTRTAFVSGEWGATITAPATGIFPLEVNLTDNTQTLTFATNIKTTSFTVTTGIVSCATVSMDTGTNGNGNVTIASGATLSSSVTGGNVFQATGSNKAGVFTLAGTLKLTGAAPTIAVNSITNTGTVEYGAAGNQAFLTAANSGVAMSYVNLKISGSGVKTQTSTNSPTGTTTINSGCTLATGAFTFSPAGATIVNGSFQIDQSGWGGNGAGAYNYGSTGTLVFNVSSQYGVDNSQKYWTNTNGPINVTVGAGGINLNNSGAARTVTGLFQSSGPISNSTANLTFSGATVQLNTSTVTFSAVPVYAGNATLVYNMGSTKITGNEWFNGGSTTVAAGAGIPSNVIIQNNTNVTLNGNRGIPGTLTVSAGATLTLNATASNDLYIGGDFAMNGTLSATNPRTLFFVLGNAQNITSANSSLSFPGGLTINKTGGAAVTLGKPLTVVGTTTLTAGFIDLTANDMTINALSGGGSSSYIKTTGAGQLKKTVAATPVLFPVGNSAYNPITLTNSGTSDSYGVVVLDGTVATALDPASAVNRRWQVVEGTGGGGNLAVTAQYNTGETGGSFSGAGTVYLGLYVPTTWVKVNAAHSGLNPFTAASTTNFTNTLTSSNYFAIGNADAFEVPLALPPTIATTVTPNAITHSTALSGGQTLTGSGITAKGVVWDFGPGADISLHEGITNQGAGSGDFISTMNGLVPQTQYYVRSYAINPYGTAYGPELSFYTTSAPADGAATGFTAAAISDSEIELNWTAPSFPGDTSNGYLILRRTDGTNPTISGVVNGKEPGNLVLPGGTVLVEALGFGAAVTTSDFGLSAGAYNYMIIPFTWDGINTDTYNYYTASAPAASAAILTTAPAAQPSNLVFSAVTYNSMALAWDAASPAAAGYIVLRTSDVSAPDTAPAGGTTYTAGNTIGNATVTYVGTGLATSLASLVDNLQYNFKIYSYNGSGAIINYLAADPLSASQATSAIAAPTANAATGMSGSAVTANWSAVTGAASYKLDVSSDNTFTAILPGYNDLTVAGTTKSVTGLAYGTSYYYRVRAVGANSTSANSNTITATTTTPKISTTTGGIWTAGTTWVGGVAPLTSEDVEIVSGAIVTINAAMTQTGSIVVSQGGTLAASAIFTTNGSVAINGTFKVTGSLSGGGSPVVSASSTGVWTYSQTTGTLFFNTSSVYNIDSGTASNVFWPITAGLRPFNVTVQAVSNGNGLQMNNNTRIIDGTFIIKGASGITANLYGNTANYTVNGMVQLDLGSNINNTGYLTFGPTATLKYNQGGTVTSTGSAWITGTAGPGLNLPGSVQVSNNTILTMPNSSNYNVKGNLTIDSGSTMNFPSANALTVSGNVTNNGTLNLGTGSGGDLSLAGNFTNNGIFTHNSRIITFTGTAQTVDGTGTITFGTARINNGTTVTLGSSATIASNLTFNSGKVVLGSSNLTMGSGAAITTPTASNYVKTNGSGQLRQIVSTATVTFPVGNSAYNPIMLANTGTSDTYGINVIDGSVATAAYPAKTLNRAWGISEAVSGGSNISFVNLQYNGGEEGAGFNLTPDTYVGLYNGASWAVSAAGTSGTNPYSVSAASAGKFTAAILPGSYLAAGKDDGLVPYAPTGDAAVAFCNAATVADLAATGSNIKWYDVATGGTALSAGTALATAHYYATQTVNGAESVSRLDVSVTVYPLSASGSIIGGGVIACSGSNSTILNLSDYTGNIQWQSSLNGVDFTDIADAISFSYTATDITATTYYRAVVTSGMCSSATTEPVTVTYHLSTTTSTTITACDTYTWADNGETYTESGTYTSTTTNGDGCPNVSTLHLTISQSAATFETVAACDTYTWTANGATYTESGTYTYTTTNESGCLNVATLDLTIGASVTYYADADGDTYGNINMPQSSCTGVPAGYVANSTDCNDADETTYLLSPIYIDADNDGWDAGQSAICHGATAPAGYSLTTAGTDCNDNDDALTNNCSTSSTVNLKLFIEGYYLGGGLMNSVKLNQDYESANDLVEELTVELHATDTFEMVYSTTAMLHTDGTMTCTFPTGPNGSYFIAVKGSNIIQTWSAEPQAVSSSVPMTYDFTTSASQAYFDNIKDMGGVFAMYSGDLNHDDVIDPNDYVIWESDFNNFSFGVFASDMTGDGVVDPNDYVIWETNFNGFVFAFYPF